MRYLGLLCVLTVSLAAACRTAVIAHDAQTPSLESLTHARVHVAQNLAEVCQRWLAASLCRWLQTAEKEAVRWARRESHLAMLRDRVVGRQLAGREDVVREPVAWGRPEIFVLELVIDGTGNGFKC